ncbi:MAG: cytochrome c [Gammaproteobacteria bacterium]
MSRKQLLLSIVLSTLLSCTDPANSGSGQDANAGTPALTAGSRWYGPHQVDAGQSVFQQHCSECHGDQAQGLADDWRERLDDGTFPPPPLNGSAHAWHHPLSVLMQVINQGGIPLGGRMPAFSGVLDEQQKLAAIAYFQQFWSDEIYQQWERMGGVN